MSEQPPQQQQTQGTATTTGNNSGVNVGVNDGNMTTGNVPVPPISNRTSNPNTHLLVTLQQAMDDRGALVTSGQSLPATRLARSLSCFACNEVYHEQ